MSKRSIVSGIVIGLLGAMSPSLSAQDMPEKRPNVLFIAVDDLRPLLGCYGHNEIHTPHIDKLADRGTVFERAYCNVPICGASRVSVMTGIRTGPKHWRTRDLNQDFITLPLSFRQHGYHAVSNGKVFHHMHDRKDDWSEPPWRSVEIYHGTKDWANCNAYGVWQNPDSAKSIHSKTKRGPYFEAADVPDNAYQDGQVADKTIADLKRLKAMNKPFFLACGFWRPHLPFNAPRKYWDLYRRDDVAPAPNRFQPKNLPGPCKSSNEIDRYALTGQLKQSDEFHREARHAYFACVSYVDAQVGKIVAELDALGLAENTIIVLWGDHGFHLGEHNFWGKHNTLNHSLHAPLIVCAPGTRKNNRTERLVELIDIYPSLCELAGLPTPGYVQGRSFVPLLNNPEQDWKQAVFAKWAGCDAVKTDRYLYTEWRKGGKVTHRMLFDHQNDPLENTNIAETPEAKNTVETLSAILNNTVQ